MMGVYYDHEAYLTILPGHEAAVRDVLTAVDESTIDSAVGAALGSLLNEFSSDYTVYDSEVSGSTVLYTQGSGKAWNYALGEPDGLLERLAPHVEGIIDWVNTGDAADQWRIRFAGGKVTRHRADVMVSFPTDVGV